MKNSLVKNTMRKSKNILLLALLIFIFLTHLYAADIQCIWTGIEKIVAVGDLHGDFDNFVTILKGIGLIDEELHWTGGKTHLVQTGDIMDRGDYAKEIFDLLIRLEQEAEEAGGKIHMLIGNHEEMNITGIAFDYEGYVTVKQFVSFLPDKYRESREKKFRKKMGGNAPKETDLDSSLNSNLIEYWEAVEHNGVIKINDIIFVHGGINEKFSEWKLEDINDRLRMELKAVRDAIVRSQPLRLNELKIVYKPYAPLWNRDLAQAREEFFKEDVDRILHNLNAKFMVIAHSPQRGISRIATKEYMSRFQGRIWIIDTGISDFYSSFLGALIIENGNFRIWFEGEDDEK